MHFAVAPSAFEPDGLALPHAVPFPLSTVARPTCASTPAPFLPLATPAAPYPSLSFKLHAKIISMSTSSNASPFPSVGPFTNRNRSRFSSGLFRIERREHNGSDSDETSESSPLVLASLLEVSGEESVNCAEGRRPGEGQRRMVSWRSLLAGSIGWDGFRQAAFGRAGFDPERRLAWLALLFRLCLELR